MAAGLLATLAFVAQPAYAAGPSVGYRQAAATALDGTLRLAPGSCAGGKITGTYFRMILPSGGTNGPYMSNNDSTCSDQSFTPLSAGADGGIRVGSYQPIPSPAFASDGDAKANRITAPQAFYGTSFATATNATDPQTRTKTPAPRVALTGSTLTADLRSFSVTWNNQHFNQGAPKPNGSLPGITRAPTGAYDATSGAFTLDWTSEIVGGPFDKFTGKWHFEGVFVPAAGTAPTQPDPSSDPTVPAGPDDSTAPTPGAVVPGAPTPGASAPGAPAPGAPSTGAEPPTASSVAAPTSATVTTDTVTEQDWSVDWPVIWLAGGFAVLGFGALIWLARTGRKTEVS
jgi:hypothetical protein